MTKITITVELDDEQAAYQLAQFCKRSTYQTFYNFTEAHLPDEQRSQRAYQMIRGIERVQCALAAAGFSPR